jgi:hypothetical protein
MLMLVEGMDKAFYSPRVYVAAETDKMSAKRALSREQTWARSQVRELLLLYCNSSSHSDQGAVAGASDQPATQL